MFTYTGAFTDFYEITMSYAYFKNEMGEKKAVFDYFFRNNPFDSGFSIFAGLETLLDALENLRFSAEELDYLANLGFEDAFVEYLKSFRFRGSLFSCLEGDVVFPNRPVMQVEGTIMEAQMIESMLLNILNFQTLVATKAARVRCVAGNKKLVDFGMRRAQGPAAYYATRASFIGGFDGTSNVAAAMDFNIPVYGTMAHSFVEAFDNEIEAFMAFAKARPKDTVLLLDTYDTVYSGLLNAIAVGKDMMLRGEKLKGVRLDSGNLGELAKSCRMVLDEAGLEQVKIAVTNQLDEHVIKRLLKDQAPVDLFGVGTKLVSGHPDAALDGVYKLSFFDGKPRLKLSEESDKISLPHRKQVHRLLDNDGAFSGTELVSLRGEKLGSSRDHEPLMDYVMRDGRRAHRPKSLEEIRARSRSRLARLPRGYKRLEGPSQMRVALSKTLAEERNALIKEHRSKRKPYEGADHR